MALNSLGGGGWLVGGGGLLVGASVKVIGIASTGVERPEHSGEGRGTEQPKVLVELVMYMRVLNFSSKKLV